MKRKFLRLFELLLVVFLTGTIASCGPKGPTSNETSNDSTSTDSSVEDEYDCITIKEAIAIATKAGETETSTFYTVRGTVDEITNPTYGEMNISDATGTIYVYGIEGYADMNPKPFKGDEVVINGKLKTFNGKAEFGRSNLLEFTPAPEAPFNEADYAAVSVNDARSKKVGDKVKLTGVVANITYTQSMVPNGFYLIDESNSIYVYDKDAVQKVKVGNTVTLCAERDDYIAGKETENAAKFGYTGCIQVKNVHLMSNDDEVKAYNNTWIKKSTIKEMMETPLSNNITTTIYNVTGYVHKKADAGFTNYFINDLDDKTGSYVYTSNSGSDFDWLDEFDGKLCDIDLSIMNAKSTATGCIYRLMPLSVKLSDFVLNEDKVSEHVLTYYAVDQFEANYNADPALEVITSVSNEKLNYADAKITYASDNEDAIYFETTAEGKVIMHTKNDGTANVTVTVSYKTYTATKTISVTKSSVDVSGTISVKEIALKEDGTKVRVKGIVTSTIANKNGVYVADETGVIAITGAIEVSTLSIGDEIYVEGTRSHNRKDTTDPAVKIGQTYIKDATILLNTFGKHEIPTTSFVNDKTVDDLYTLNVKDDYTTTVYTVKGKLIVESGKYSTNYYIQSLTDPETKIMMYKGSTSQYAWLDSFNDKEVTVNMALCNWNDKAYYTGCILSATDGTTTLYNDVNLKK